MVRRPLGTFCLGISLLILLIIQLAEMPGSEELPEKAGEAVVTGTVYRKESRRQNEECAQVLYIETAEQDRIICYLKPGQEEAQIGSTVRLRGRLSGFEKASNPGQFDAYSYYQISKISFRLSQAELLAKSITYSLFREGLYQLRVFFSEQLTQALPQKEAGVMQTMLLGDKAMLDGDLKALYQQNGIAHILAISGLHISLLGMGLYRLLRRIGVPMKAAAGVGAVFLVLYGVMTGFSVSAVRAIIMFAFRMTAIILERSYDALTALGFAGALLLLWQPLYWYHSGFVFSFGCVLGITVLLPVLAEGDGAVSPRSRHGSGWAEALRSKLLSGCAVAVITFPIYLIFYYQFPMYSVLLNLIVLPLMSLLLAAGILVVFLQLCFPPLVVLPALLIRGILWFYEWLCRLADSLPEKLITPGMPVTTGKLITPGMPGKWQGFAAVAILLLLLLFQKRMQLWMRWAAAVVALLLLVWHPKSGLIVTFLDVGQGDCIYIESESGKSYLVDGGSSSVNEVGKYRIIPFLKYQGAGAVEAVFVTHSDQDHCNGVLELLETAGQQGIRIKNLVLPNLPEANRDEAYRKLEEAAHNAGVSVSYISAGQKVQDGKLQMICLHPAEDFSSGDSNACSMVLAATYGDFRMLLTGDIEGEGERQLVTKLEAAKSVGAENSSLAVLQSVDAGSGSSGITSLSGTVTVLKAAHHGSGNSTSEEFLKLTSPSYTVISCGKNNHYGHPHKETLGRLEEIGSCVYRTDESGAIQIWMSGKRLRIKGYLEGK